MNTLHNVLYTVSDLAAAKELHAKLLDAQPHTDSPYYVGFNVGGVEIGMTPAQGGQPTGAVAHVLVPDINASIEQALGAGATLVSEPRDVGAGNLVAAIADKDGTVVGLMQGAS